MMHMQMSLKTAILLISGIFFQTTLGVSDLPAISSNTLTHFSLQQFDNASIVKDNPIGKLARATLPQETFFKTDSLNGNIRGSLTVQSSADGVGVIYTASFSNLPLSGGPFLYHIHEAGVPDGCNCNETLAHLDPTKRGENPPCDSTHPETCQVGDLSGKYGAITGDHFVASYHDQFSSMNVGSAASIPDRSVVIHFANKTRITCANFVVDQCTGNSTMPTPDPPADPTTVPTFHPSASNSTVPGTPTPTFVVVTGAGNALHMDASRPVVAVLAVFFFWL